MIEDHKEKLFKEEPENESRIGVRRKSALFQRVLSHLAHPHHIGVWIYAAALFIFLVVVSL